MALQQTPRQSTVDAFPLWAGIGDIVTVQCVNVYQGAERLELTPVVCHTFRFLLAVVGLTTAGHPPVRALKVTVGADEVRVGTGALGYEAGMPKTWRGGVDSNTLRSGSGLSGPGPPFPGATKESLHSTIWGSPIRLNVDIMQRTNVIAGLETACTRPPPPRWSLLVWDLVHNSLLSHERKIYTYACIYLGHTACQRSASAWMTVATVAAPLCGLSGTCTAGLGMQSTQS